MIVDKITIIERKKIEDHRGWFLKVINGKEDNLPSATGEFYVTVATPNQSKGGHYHLISKEWFTLIKGECLLELVDVETKEYVSIPLSEKEPKTIYVPNNIAHNFKNTDDTEFILLAYSDILYDPNDTISFEF
ncbi:WxcM-like domain-containing protein [Flavobacterium sp. LB1P62]|uniref:polysaccharide biosynthesis C-terminal domain-containing protein n=1 Tax=Flavobacterium sp. LB1P62 TaxID=3401715 RepID=UPI003AAA605B